ncbi:40S ribosomal protein S30-like [Hibiscus syriacus]|uniref:40S ribosomal protein S30-like n=1 Tax=Hibiscus syriacus TaxID=106335 RepID=UPI001921AC2D|nr:40S ribosomal protein S30-like [Hibiscus syriacus]
MVPSFTFFFTTSVSTDYSGNSLIILGKVHGSLARAGKVRGQTPKVAKQDKKKKPRGRAYKKMQYNRRFVTAVVGFGKERGPNSSEK